MMLELVLLLLPLLIGYGIPPLSQPIENTLNRILGVEIYIILVLMGASLTSLPHWIEQLQQLWWQTMVLTGLILVFNLLGLWVVMKIVKRASVSEVSYTASCTSASNQSDETWDDTESRANTGVIGSLRSALLPVLLVVTGIALGEACSSISHAASFVVTLLIYLLLLLIGHQLRDANVSLKRLVMNRLGVSMAGAVIISSALAGLCSMPFLHMSLAASVALSSGFGWYSLSSVMLNNLLGPYYGGLALCNDLAREIVAIMLMPLLFKRGAPMAIGYCGATAMDVTLPLIRRQGGVAVLPLALCSGFLLSLASPLLMVLLSMIAQ